MRADRRLADVEQRLRLADAAGLNDRQKASELEVIGKASKRETGTTVHFWPDGKYFDTVKFGVKALKHNLRAKAVLCPGLRIRFTDASTTEPEVTEWYYQSGLRDYLNEAVSEFITLPEDPFTGSPSPRRVKRSTGHCCGSPEGGTAIQESYVNLIPTVQGGTHVNGLRTGVTDALREYCEFRNLLPRGMKLTPMTQ